MFFAAWVRKNTVNCDCTAKFSDQVWKGPASEEQHQPMAWKIPAWWVSVHRNMPRMTRLFTGESGACEGSFSMQPHLRPLMAGYATTYPVVNSSQVSASKAIQDAVTAGCNSWWKTHHLQFCTKMQQHLEEDSFTKKVIFNDEAMLYLHGRWIDTLCVYRELKMHMLRLSKYKIIQNWTFSMPIPTGRCTDHFYSPSQESLARPILICCRNG